MKKFYAVAAVALTFCVAANATGVYHAPEFKKIAGTPELNLSVSKSAKLSKAPAKAPSAADYYGMYKWICMSGLENAQNNQTFDMTNMIIVPGAAENEVYIKGFNVFSPDVEVKGYINPAEGTLTIPSNQLLGKYTANGANEDVYYMNYTMDDAGNLYDAGNVVMALQDGILMPPLECLIANWVPTLDGGFLLMRNNVFEKRVETLSMDGWKDLGTGKFTDGWINNMLSVYNIAQIGNEPYEVKVQESTDQEGLIRIVNPYGKGTAYEAYNSSPCEGAIYIDMSNEQCVLVNQYETTEIEVLTYNDGSHPTYPDGSYTGFYLKDALTTIYPGNVAFYYVYGEGFDVQDVLDEIGSDFDDPESEISCMKDGVIRLYGNCFGGDGSVASTFAGWTEIGQLTTPVLVLPSGDNSVETIAGVDANAPVEYYNLQGVKINAPAEGDIVIVRQGASVKKVVVK